MYGYCVNFNFHYKSNHKISHKLYFEIATFSIYSRIIYRKNKMIFIIETNNLNDSYNIEIRYRFNIFKRLQYIIAYFS